MSVTELQVIHRVTQTTSSTTPRFLLPNDADSNEDMGLMMRLDNKLKDSNRPLAPVSSVKTPVTAQFCGKPHVIAEWSLWASSFLQTPHIAFLKSTSRMSDAIQTKATRMLPLLLYMSLLVLALQAAAIVALFAMSACPMGLWFLLACIANLGGIYWYTAIQTIPAGSFKLPSSNKTKPSS